MIKGKYTQVKDLRAGGSSQIVKVQNMVNQEFYASKIMAVKKEQMLKVEQIRQEIRFLSELKHSNNIVKFIESNENEPFDNILEFRIILELAEGDLGELIANQKERKEYLSEECILKLMKGILKGVEYCHERNIIHNDLKPKNILIKEGIPKLCDFGSATELENSIKYILIPNKEGTKGYMAPEIWEEGRYSYKSDVWALGCIFYELCTFGLPYFPQYSTNNLCDNSPKLAQYSPQLRAIVDEMLNIDYKQRPSLNHLKKRINYLTKPAIGNIPTIQSFPQYKDTEDREQILDINQIKISKIKVRPIVNKSKNLWRMHPFCFGGIIFFIFSLFIAIAFLSYFLHKANNEIYKLEDKIKEIENNTSCHILRYQNSICQANNYDIIMKLTILQNELLNRSIDLYQKQDSKFMIKQKINKFEGKLLKSNNEANNKIYARKCNTNKRELYIIKYHGITKINSKYEEQGDTFFPLNFHKRGNINSVDLYITAYPHNNNDIFGYLYDLRDLKKDPILLYPNSRDNQECYFINDIDILCATYTGYIYKYTLNNNLTSFTYTQFAHIDNAKLDPFSCIQTSSDLILVSGWPLATVHVFDKSGEPIAKLNAFNSYRRSYDIIEIWPDIIMSAEDVGGCYLHNITNIRSKEHPVTTTKLNLPLTITEYRSLLVLKQGGNNYFAIGGRHNLNGMIQICELHKNLSVSVLKEKLDIPSEDCIIDIVRELQEGKIYFGGIVGTCEVACTWEYITEEQPQCFNITNLILNSPLKDIVSVCANQLKKFVFLF